MTSVLKRFADRLLAPGRARGPVEPLIDTDWYLAMNEDVAAAGMDPVLHYVRHGERDGRRPNRFFDPRWYASAYPDAAGSPLSDYARRGWRLGRRPGPDFDPELYAATFPELNRSATDPLRHAIEQDRKKRRERETISSLIDGEWYLAMNPDVAAAGLDPVSHYIESGARQGRRPNPFFDPTWYVLAHPDLAGEANPLLHYAEHGWKEGRRPSAEFHPDLYAATSPELNRSATDPLRHAIEQDQRKRREREAISSLIDGEWYLAMNPDVAAGLDPVSHYIEAGAAEGRRPNAFFDPAWYVLENPDLASEPNPLVHYAEHGWKEGRRPSAEFDPDCYVTLYPGLADRAADPLRHCIAHGRLSPRERETIAPYIDRDWYRRTYPDIGEAGVDPVSHFIDFGVKEGRRPNPFFDPRWYLATYPDTATTRNPLLHYVQHGWREGRQPCPEFYPALSRKPGSEPALGAARPFLDAHRWIRLASRTCDPRPRNVPPPIERSGVRDSAVAADPDVAAVRKRARERQALFRARDAITADLLERTFAEPKAAEPIRAAQLGRAGLRPDNGLAAALRSGWYEVEDWGVWSRSPVARLVLELDESVRLPARLLLDVVAWIPSSGIQRVRAVGPGSTVAAAEFSREAPDGVLTLDIDRHAVQGGRGITVSLEISNPEQPGNGEERTLGLGIKSIRIEPRE